MPRFIVRFLKEILGENGRMSEVCQTTVELEAQDESDAERKAKLRFCDIHGIHDWSLHADRLKIDPGRLSLVVPGIADPTDYIRSLK